MLCFIKFIFEYITKREIKKRASLDVRVMSFLYQRRLIFLSKYWKRKIQYKYAMDIDYRARIHSTTKFDHTVGIVIGEHAVIHENVTLLQCVTLGGSFNSTNSQIIEAGTILCAGAKIIGNVKIGKKCIVGANAVVTKDVPEGKVVVGYNKIIDHKSEKYL